jgi:glycosyltransferase involved in cell wall biosynthesis
MKVPFISICIPAYKRIDYLSRLLDSIAIQHFKDFEVVVTDDSPSEEVQTLCSHFKNSFELKYFKNQTTLGTPENWNEAIRKSTGSWIKLMHDDDWFSDAESLGAFASAAKEHPGNFIFSSYINVFIDKGRKEIVKPSHFRFKQLKKNALTLLSSNIIGPPSVTMHKRNPLISYDKNLKWLVDIDYYYSWLKTEKPVWINKNLVCVGLSEDQVTASCHRNPEVEIPESFYLLKKTGISHLQNIMIYDAWWRLFRNLDIRSEADLDKLGDFHKPPVILEILRDVNKVSKNSLRSGVVSKFKMGLSYLHNRKKIK